ncbi:MAG: tRNA (5-methylaminomethyl-2-thiouridine)(34)-methyltransferase MnmD [Flavobacterium sp.]|jgi:tRNA U34 5-methylaminomethyl-2-thiouridine-forming methyltransferase MnmC
MKRVVVHTADGSTSIHLPGWNESYHSKHGAIQEAQHVFIKNGLDLFQDQNLSILEIGFGTGLNAFITLLESPKRQLTIHYTGIEAYPVSLPEVQAMNYVTELHAQNQAHVFDEMHSCTWEQLIFLSPTFSICKRQQRIQDIQDIQQFDLIYFDAFGYRVQPELWSDEIFQSMYTALKPSGVLVTYAATGAVRRSMLAAGFAVEKLAGPPGKREMLRATKH